jgi:spermidine synthase
VLQVPIIHSSQSPYQSIKVLEVPGQMGRCLLLNGIIQFCAYDLDHYTDHMARQPLQMLQEVRGYNRFAAAGQQGEAAAAGAAGVPALAAPGFNSSTSSSEGESVLTEAPRVALPFAGSNPTPLHVSCRAHLLLPGSAWHGTADAGAETDAAVPSNSSTQQHRKARVLMVGGGDGWIAKHLVGCYGDWVSEVQIVEIDQAVSQVTEKYFGSSSSVGRAAGSSSSSVNPFNHPRIKWEYTDAFAWVLKHVEKCGRGGGTAADGAGGPGYTENLNVTTGVGGAGPAMTAIAHHRHASSSDSSGSGSATGQPHTEQAGGIPARSHACEGFDIVIIDSTDFSEKAAANLHSAAFYKALYQLMSPQASLIQLVEIYMREFEGAFASIANDLRQAGFTRVGRSGVYTPAYSGETVFMQAVKDSKQH